MISDKNKSFATEKEETPLKQKCACDFARCESQQVVESDAPSGLLHFLANGKMHMLNEY